MESERKRYAFIRYSISGALFTLMGPTFFWILYPIGPYFAVATTEVFMHAIRFYAFRCLVFPKNKGYRVSPSRYIVSALPVTLSSFACVGLLKNSLDRTALALTAALVSIAVGFLWSRLAYTQNYSLQNKRCHLLPGLGTRRSTR